MSKYLLVFLLFNLNSLLAQEEVETIIISKKKAYLYQGVGTDLQNWYLYIDKDKVWYLANLYIDVSEIEKWFELRKDSQSILKGIESYGAIKSIYFQRENDPSENILFYIEHPNTKQISLIQILDNLCYKFQLIEIFDR
jgi:hypothetical protein